MRHHVIPASFRIEPGSGENRFRSAIGVGYANDACTAIVEHFCREAWRRTELQFKAKPPHDAMGMDVALPIRIGIAADSTLSALPAWSFHSAR